jgi:predicted dehydrogenase
MAGVCRETETELVINHSFRFSAKLQALRELILEDGLIGDVRSVDARFRMELIGTTTASALLGP